MAIYPYKYIVLYMANEYWTGNHQDERQLVISLLQAPKDNVFA